MRVAKKFDCVKIKDQIQAELMEQHDGLGDEEIRKRTQRKLAASDSTVAKLWQALVRSKTGKP